MSVCVCVSVCEFGCVCECVCVSVYAPVSVSVFGVVSQVIISALIDQIEARAGDMG